MANIFTIKHGTGNPSHKLQPYELGYSTDEEKLYIGGEADEENGILGVAIPVSGNIEITENSTGGQFVYYKLGSDGKVQLSANEKLIISNDNYGNRLPTTGQIGQVYFVI